MLNGFIVLLIFFLLGEFIANLFNWPIPGSVMGMLLLFVYLIIRSGIPKSIKHSSETLLPYLPLFIVPASVGIVSHLYLLKQDGLLILLAMVVSLVVGIPFCGWLMQKILQWQAK
jgi:holin-like protein